MTTISDVIQARKSTRNYNPSRSIDSKVKQDLLSVMNEKSTQTFRFKWVKSDLNGIKLGTYGFIGGATNFLVGITKDKSREATIQFGSAFEEVILHATSLGLHTCWMMGSYNAKDFSKALNLTEDESIVIVSPVGYGKGDTRKRDKLLKLMSQNHRRKPWDTLFFKESWESPLSEKSAHKYSGVMEMVRKSPSANNGQPWRIICEDNTFHFYMFEKQAKALRGFNSGYNDLGIAMSHFELTAKEKGIKGEWTHQTPSHLKKKGLEYIRSWVEIAG